ncbi:nicotinate-nucleotide--dimethylbenzimidazole phosphoribosyltransferase [Lipingzhangella halophila]|uniref:Nicotinate-nucleotide--dimethylbenzimidazole phosphoribosyltransferase n=1 Tax=Lipingzhangella halophila TaxID=1783352 RepID=A0A7W7RK11_9ACTN|nr:nicotinate-nucleotide--dimethylbenzimidazole phosphoribosyltransferase [Lipingzhangella halophila]MBB4933262.1 nicotinate-nucleotide--dimethylbenzimidazole phosphoribosyltransferase [Lipingzhangella halophila]
MSADDRRDPVDRGADDPPGRPPADHGRRRAAEPDPLAGSGGGLLDDLPETGRGYAPLDPPEDDRDQHGRAAGRHNADAAENGPAHRNPFHTPVEEPTPPPPPRDTTRREPAPEPPRPAAEDPLQPNVIPFRGAGPERATATPPRRAAEETGRAAPEHAEANTAAGNPGTGAGDPPRDPRDRGRGQDSGAPASVPPESTGRVEPSEGGQRPEEPAPRVSELDPHAYAQAERDAVYRVIRERRDVRVGFRTDPIPSEVLTRVLAAAHQAPSVGFSQPWDFVVVEDGETRSHVREMVQTQREEYARALPGARARAFSGLKVEAILDTPVNIVVTVDSTRGGRHTLGRHTQPQMSGYSTALAVENLWLAARAEGLGVGWVSFFEERALARALDLPPHLEVVAYLCVGYVDDFPPEPELSLGGWAKRRPLSWAVHRESYGRRGLPGEEPTSLLDETIAGIRPLNQRAINEARDRQDQMTKPPGSLGVLEDVSVQLAGLAGECPPPIPEPAAVAVFAGDHGVHAQKVTAWPQDVTTQMVHNFLNGGAVVNAFAEQVGTEVTIVDVGVVGDLPTVPGLLPRKVARGTADITQGPALTRTQAVYAIEAGVEVARDLVSAGNRCLVTGDMGIANTTPSAALIAAFTGFDPADITGRGTGLDEAAHEHKIEVVRRALEVNAVDPNDPTGVLAAVGGLEHAALAGFILGAAATGVPVLLDGVISGSAALAAAALSPASMNACFAGHCSAEPGHTVALRHLGLHPLFGLEMRLGEGSGALLALPMLQASVRALRDVATFDAAGVAGRA